MFEFSFFGKKVCLFGQYFTLGLGFMPPGGSSSFVMPANIITSAFGFGVIAYTGLQSIEIGNGIIQKIITFNVQARSNQSMMYMADLAKGGTQAATQVVEGAPKQLVTLPQKFFRK
jgi:hypothetical protein